MQSFCTSNSRVHSRAKEKAPRAGTCAPWKAESLTHQGAASPNTCHAWQLWRSQFTLKVLNVPSEVLYTFSHQHFLSLTIPIALMGKLRCNIFGCSAQRHTVVTAKPQCNPICLASPPTRSLLSHLWLSSLAALDLGLPPFACSVPSSPASGISTRALSSGTKALRQPSLLRMWPLQV